MKLAETYSNLGFLKVGHAMRTISGFSSFLFARPSFLEGWARIVDFGGTLQEYNRSPTDQAADFYALAADWRAVGLDIRQAINEPITKPSSTGVQNLNKKEAKRKQVTCSG